MALHFYGTAMAYPTISMPDEMLEDLESRAEDAGTNRSRYIREAIVARFESEDSGEWDPPESYTVEVDRL